MATTATSLKYPTPSTGTSGGQRTTAAPSATSESRIDSDSHFNGLYETKQNLRIEGIAEGEIQCQGTLTVAEGAQVKAKVTASTITIAGALEGEVVCRGIFQIMPSGQVDATVSARRLIVQEGGVYNGEFRMIADEPAPEKASPGGAPAKAGQAAAPGARPAAKKEDLPVTRAPGTLSSDEWWAKMTGDANKGEQPKGEAPKGNGEAPKGNGEAKPS